MAYSNKQWLIQAQLDELQERINQQILEAEVRGMVDYYLAEIQAEEAAAKEGGGGSSGPKEYKASWIKDGAGTVLRIGGRFAARGAKAVLDTARATPGAVGSAVGSASAAIKRFNDDPEKVMTEMYESSKKSLGSFVAARGADLQKQYDNLPEGTRKRIGEEMDKEYAKNAKKKVQDMIGQIGAGGEAAFTTAIANISKAVKGAQGNANQAGEAVKGIGTAIKDAFDKFYSQKSMDSVATGIGAAMGFMSGLMASAGAAAKGLGDKINKGLDKLSEKLDEASWDDETRKAKEVKGPAVPKSLVPDKVEGGKEEPVKMSDKKDAAPEKNLIQKAMEGATSTFDKMNQDMQARWGEANEAAQKRRPEYQKAVAARQEALSKQKAVSDQDAKDKAAKEQLRQQYRQRDKAKKTDKVGKSVIKGINELMPPSEKMAPDRTGDFARSASRAV